MYVLCAISKGLMKVVLSALDSFEMQRRKALIGAPTHSEREREREYESIIHISRSEFSRLSQEVISTRFWVSKFFAESD